MTRSAMFGSGARIGTGLIHQQACPTPQDPRLVRSVWSAAAAGAAPSTTSARRGATTTRPTATASATTSASVPSEIHDPHKQAPRSINPADWRESGACPRLIPDYCRADTREIADETIWFGAC